MKKIKPEALKQINKWVKEFSVTVQDNCDYYAFYRARVYATDRDDIIGIQFLTSNIDGAIKSPILFYHSDTDELECIGRDAEKLKFRNMGKVVEAIRTFVERIISFNQPINRVLFDFCIHHADIREGYVRDLKKNPGEIAMYLVSTDPYETNYNLTEATDKGGLEICATWSTEAEVEFKNFDAAGC